jgi:hypothetical protein
MMKSFNYLSWFRRMLVLGAVVAGATASAAGAYLPTPESQGSATANVVSQVGRPPDVQDTATALYRTPEGVKADGLRWQGIAQTYQQLASARNFPTPLGLKADGLRLQGMAQVYQLQIQAVPDVVERYAATHQGGTQSLVSRPPDIRDTANSLTASVPDVFERFAAVHADGLGFSSNAASVSRPPDISDTALAVQYGSVGESKTGFNWGDWAIGIGSGIGLALLLGACFLMSRQLRHRVQTA